jgi:hypothetical protein
MGYRTEKIAEGLLVYDVPLMLPMLKGEHGVAINIDESWFASAIKLFDERKRLGKFARYKEGHSPEAAVIGHLVALRFNSPWLVTDILITDPVAIAKFDRGEMPSLSAEFVDSAEWPLIWGAASTAGDMAHFEEKPDLMPEELAEKLKTLGANMIRCAAPKDATKSATPTKPAAASDAYGAPANQHPAGEEKPAESPDEEDEKVRMQKELTEALQRIGDLEKGLKQAQDAARAAQAKPPVEAADKEEEMPMSDAEKNPMEAPPAGEKPVEKGAVPAEKPAEKKLAADETIESGVVYSVVKRDEKFCVVLKASNETKKGYNDKEDAVDYLRVLETLAHQTRLTAAVKTLKDAGCPLKVDTILAKLSATKTPEEFDKEMTELKFVPKWQDLASGDGAKVDKTGKALSTQEQVRLYLSDCDGKGMSRSAAIIKMSKEHKELYKAWTGSEPR